MLLLLSLVQSFLQSLPHLVTAVLTGTIRFAVVTAPIVTAVITGTIRFAVVAAPDVTAVLTGTIRFAIVAAPNVTAAVTGTIRFAGGVPHSSKVPLRHRMLVLPLRLLQILCFRGGQKRRDSGLRQQPVRNKTVSSNKQTNKQTNKATSSR